MKTWDTAEAVMEKLAERKKVAPAPMKAKERKRIVEQPDGSAVYRGGPGECPVCAARKAKQREATKRWREKQKK
jgi:hypothetical protein